MCECKCDKNRKPVENEGDKAWDICDECMRNSQKRKNKLMPQTFQ